MKKSLATTFLLGLFPTSTTSSKKFIVEHAEFDSEVTALLQRDHDDIRADLRSLNEIALGIAERLDSFALLAKQAHVPEALSKQALQILVMFVDTEGDVMTRTPVAGEQWPVLEVFRINEGYKSIGNFSEPRMLNSDLDSLVACGLLTDGIDNDDFRTFGITREAMHFVKRLDRNELFAD